MSKKFCKYISVIILVIYICLFYILQPYIGNSITILSIIPVLLFTWSFNLRYGLIIQLLLILNIFVSFKILDEDISNILSFGMIIGTSANIVFIFVLFYFKILIKKTRIAKWNTYPLATNDP